jgi:hypothetical protein
LKAAGTISTGMINGQLFATGCRKPGAETIMTRFWCPLA